jgi:predicted nucleic acid-binding protein
VIILDTDVLSESIRPVPTNQVVAWMAAQPASSLFTTSVVEAELFYGVGLLAHGTRRAALASAVKAIFEVDLAGRVIPFDSDCGIEVINPWVD